MHTRHVGRLQNGAIAFAFLALGLGTVEAETIFFEENFDVLAGDLQPAVTENIPASVLGWTHTPPEGWHIDNSGMGSVKGMTEWQGWSFATMDFWLSAATQNRQNFELSDGVFAIADPDEWDDRNNPSASGKFDSVLRSPPISVTAGQQLYLYFDSHYRQEGDQRAQVRVSFNGGDETVVLDYHGGGNADNGGADAENTAVVLPLPQPAADGTLVIQWALFDARNNWYWAFDNVKVSDSGPPPPPPTPTPMPTPAPILSSGPYVQIVDEGTARVFWKTHEAGSSILEYGIGGLDNRVEDSAPKTDHEITLTGLAPETDYTYAIKSAADGLERFAGDFLLDTTFDSAPIAITDGPSPYAVDSLTPFYEAAASYALARANAEKGYCLVYGFGEGRLAYEIAKRSQLKIIGIEEDAEKVAQARSLLRQAGVYGDRISVRQGSLHDLPYGKYFANLIVSDRLIAEGRIDGAAEELLRVLRPCGGVLCLGQPAFAPNLADRGALESWLQEGGITDYTVSDDADGLWITKTRGPLPESGEWTHAYAEPGNSASSEDRLIQQPVGMLWYGRPGPRLIVNRHSRPMSSLYKNGRVFIPADDRIIAIDAYNGTRLWDLAVPGSRRLGAFKGSGQMVVSDEYVYITQRDQCLAVDVKTGLPVFAARAPQLSSGEREEWGYLATVGSRLFGTTHKAGTPFYEYTSNGNCDVLEGDGRACMISDSIFCQDRHSGETAWRYERGAILESAIAVADGRVYFAENRSLPPASGRFEGPGRRWVGNFTSGDSTYLVALDKRNGDLVWERKVDLPFTEVMYLSHADDKVLTVGSFNQSSRCRYGIFTYDAETGEPGWATDYDSGKGTGGSHGEQWQHPVVVGDTLYSSPYAFDLATGERLQFNLNRQGHHCGTLSGSAFYLYGRGSTPRIYDLSRSGSIGPALSEVTRPGCFINTIPAGGLILIPESSSGCTCNYSVQTSMAFVAE